LLVWQQTPQRAFMGQPQARSGPFPLALAKKQVFNVVKIILVGVMLESLHMSWQ